MKDLNNEALTHEIIQRLKINFEKIENINFPFIIAGGAVANTIFSILYNIDIPIHDIDIFYITKKDEVYQIIREPFHTREIIEEILGKATEYTLKIIFDVYNDGIYNFIKTGNPLISHGLYDYGENIIDSFDLNCTEVGITFPDLKLIYTNNFLDFLKNKKIKITSTRMEAGTILRLYKKCLDFNFPMENIDHEIDRVTNTLYLLNRIENHKGFIILEKYFKEKYEKIKKFADNDFYFLPDQENYIHIFPKREALSELSLFSKYSLSGYRMYNYLINGGKFITDIVQEKIEPSLGNKANIL